MRTTANSAALASPRTTPQVTATTTPFSHACDSYMYLARWHPVPHRVQQLDRTVPGTDISLGRQFARSAGAVCTGGQDFSPRTIHNGSLPPLGSHARTHPHRRGAVAAFRAVSIPNRRSQPRQRDLGRTKIETEILSNFLAGTSATSATETSPPELPSDRSSDG